VSIYGWNRPAHVSFISFAAWRTRFKKEDQRREKSKGENGTMIIASVDDFFAEVLNRAMSPLHVKYSSRCLALSEPQSYLQNQHQVYQNKSRNFSSNSMNICANSKNSLKSLVVNDCANKILFSFQIRACADWTKKLLRSWVCNHTIFEDRSQFAAWRKACCG